MREKGSITIYMSLVLLLMMALLFTLLESARVSGLQVDADRMTQAASESVFAEYQKELLEMYDLFFLDGSYGTGDFSADNAAARMMTFLKANAQTQSSTSALGIDFLNLVPESALISAFRLATDDDGAAYYDMACAYAQSALGAEVLSNLMTLLTGGEDLQDEEEEETFEQIEEALDALEDETAYSEEMNDDLTQEEIEAAEEVSEETKGILQAVQEIKSNGILALLVDDTDDLSDQTLDTADLYAARELQTGTWEETEPEGSRLLFQWYLGEKLTSFSDEAQDHALAYELEYCYAGKDSDLENLKSTAEAILLIREGVNYAYLQTDSEKKSEARVIAIAIAGIFALPSLLSVIEQALLLAWAFLESVNDVQILLGGGSLPVIKSASDWKTDLSISSISCSTADSDETSGLTYENYLQLLLLTRTENTLITRSLNLIEQNVRLAEEDEQFRIDQCIAAASWSVTWSGSPMFLSFSNMTASQGIGSYHFISEGSFQYQ